jgi:hypothetical protein
VNGGFLFLHDAPPGVLHDAPPGEFQEFLNALWCVQPLSIKSWSTQFYQNASLPAGRRGLQFGCLGGHGFNLRKWRQAWRSSKNMSAIMTRLQNATPATNPKQNEVFDVTIAG